MTDDQMSAAAYFAGQGVPVEALVVTGGDDPQVARVRDGVVVETYPLTPATRRKLSPKARKILELFR